MKNNETFQTTQHLDKLVTNLPQYYIDNNESEVAVNA